MSTTITAATASLEAYKGHVQQTIDHISSGVTNLNEDQVFTAESMLNGLESEWDDVKDAVLAAIKPAEAVGEAIVANMKAGAPGVVTAIQNVTTGVISAVETDAKAVVGDVEQAVEHPIQTAEAIGADVVKDAEAAGTEVVTAVEHPVATVEAVAGDVAKDATSAETKVESFIDHLKDEASAFFHNL